MLTADVTSFTQSSFDLDTGTLTILVSCVVELHSDQNTYNFTFIVVRWESMGNYNDRLRGNR